MADFGALTALISLVLATYAGAASLVGVRRNNLRLLESGRAAVYALAAVLGLASIAMVQAFVAGDYSIKYVQHYSDDQAPMAYKIAAYWGGLDGSMLFWVALLAVFAAIAVYTNRHRQREILPYAIAVIAVVTDFFLYLIIYEKNPFDTFLTEIPATGQGLNPLLQNPYMVTHPPALYGGFVGLTIPFAFAMAALISGKLDDTWVPALRRWALASWFMLTLGLVLGMIWAYEVLGWGGFWGWDPVENAGLLPWLTATGMLHSMKVLQRRGQLRRWTYTLVILSFFLTIFGTFMTRSGIVQ
jgi:cytochrome c-type biogenesis protein CcmF